MKIEAGEYVRLDDGTIGKYEVNKNWINVVETNDRYIGFDIEKDVVKHSKNIIDLIEIGDYVNGYRVLEKTKIKNNEMQICILKDNNCSNWRTVNDKTLKSICTKEQFAQAEYKIEN